MLAQARHNRPLLFAETLGDGTQHPVVQRRGGVSLVLRPVERLVPVVRREDFLRLRVPGERRDCALGEELGDKPLEPRADPRRELAELLLALPPRLLLPLRRLLPQHAQLAVDVGRAQRCQVALARGNRLELAERLPARPRVDGVRDRGDAQDFLEHGERLVLPLEQLPLLLLLELVPEVLPRVLAPLVGLHRVVPRVLLDEVAHLGPPRRARRNLPGDRQRPEHVGELLPRGGEAPLHLLALSLAALVDELGEELLPLPHRPHGVEASVVLDDTERVLPRRVQRELCLPQQLAERCHRLLLALEGRRLGVRLEPLLRARPRTLGVRLRVLALLLLVVLLVDAELLVEPRPELLLLQALLLLLHDPQPLQLLEHLLVLLGDVPLGLAGHGVVVIRPPVVADVVLPLALEPDLLFVRLERLGLVPRGLVRLLVVPVRLPVLRLRLAPQVLFCEWCCFFLRLCFPADLGSSWQVGLQRSRQGAVLVRKLCQTLLRLYLQLLQLRL